jgi:hypothetical protein
MATLNNIKDRLIDRILITKNKKLLTAIDNILDSAGGNEKLILNSEQIEMLKMSEKDIEQDNLISEMDLKKSDSEWMS